MTFAEALLEIAARCPMPTDEMRLAIADAIRTEFGLEPEPEPEPEPELSPVEAELAALRAQVAALTPTPIAPVDPRDAEIAALRAQLTNAGLTPGK